MKFIFTAFILLVSLMACDGAANLENVGESKGCEPLDYHNGVYYFPCNEATFGNALSAFLTERPGVTVAAMTGDGQGSHGRDQGYFVVLAR